MDEQREFPTQSREFPTPPIRMLDPPISVYVVNMVINLYRNF